jgi:hypothetical protein
MRELADRRADGCIKRGLWMTDVPAELASGNRPLDEAAVGARRDPREMRLFGFVATSG